MSGQTEHQRAMEIGSSAGLGQYGRFGVMLLLSFLAMYFLMYSMVDGFSSVYSNINQVYMAGLMAAPMATFELLVMRSMYPDKRLNGILLLLSVLSTVFFFFGIRIQYAVGDHQFLRSMIPHHSGAILMCDEAKLTNQKIKDLCRNIVASQKKEIDEMKALLAE
jgi:hypothetical protein